LDPYYQDYPLLVDTIKNLAFNNGFSGKYFADELLWLTVTEEDWEGGLPVSPTTATKYYLRAITMHRGLGVNVTINIFFLAGELAPVHNLNALLAGAIPFPLTISVANSSNNVIYYAFTLPNLSQYGKMEIQLKMTTG